MSKKQTDELQDETHQDDDPMLLNIWVSLKSGKVEINREEVGRALLYRRLAMIENIWEIVH